MGDTARAEIPATSPCEKCAGPCAVELDGGKARLACRSCGHASEVAVLRVALGTWTVVDPDGIVRRFTSWQELIGSLPIASTPYTGGLDDRSTRSSRPSRPSAAALLDVTPAPSSVALGAPRLSLVPGDDPPPLPRQAQAQAQAQARVVETIEDLPEDDMIPASDEVTARMPPVRVSMPPPLPAAASLRPPAPAASPALAASPAPAASSDPSDPSDPSEPPTPPALPPPPPAPKGGTLRTLPPPARRDLPAPPPPTIEVEAAPASGRADKSSGRPVGGASDPPRAAASHPPSRAAEPAAGRWFVPFVAVGILALGFAYWRRSSSAESELNGAVASAATSTTSVVNDPRAVSSVAANGAASATEASHASSSSSSSPSSPPSPSSTGPASSGDVSAAALEAKPPTTGSVPERASVGDSQLSLPELLERAAAARKSGDAPHAKALLERALALSPGNAEAHGLLADLARSQGDQAGAKGGYEKALATSPSYYPALLGLADTEWDLGERDAAQRHYMAIVALGRSAPDRVKERAFGGASSASTSSSHAGGASTAAASTPAAPTSTAGATTESAPAPSP